MFLVRRCLSLITILALGLQSSRLPNWRRILIYEKYGVAAFLSDHIRYQGARLQDRSTSTRRHSATALDFDSTIFKQDPLNKISISQVNSPLINDEANTDVNVECKFVSTRNSYSGGWMERLQQLRDYKENYGHTMVPKRYKYNPSLGNWVVKQRQLYHKFQMGTTPCSLTQERVDLLNQLNFCWNATSSSMRKNSDSFEQDLLLLADREWWSRYEELSKHCQHQDGIHTILRQSKLGIWLDRQRKNYSRQQEYAVLDIDNGTLTNMDRTQLLSSEKLSALSRISDLWWMSHRQWQWEIRYRELQQFVSKYGHCCVPISYSDNMPLAHWVSNQRKLYNLRNAGKRSELTTTRIQKLEEIGFVWNRWEYEFTKKQLHH